MRAYKRRFAGMKKKARKRIMREKGAGYNGEKSTNEEIAFSMVFFFTLGRRTKRKGSCIRSVPLGLGNFRCFAINHHVAIYTTRLPSLPSLLVSYLFATLLVVSGFLVLQPLSTISFSSVCSSPVLSVARKPIRFTIDLRLRDAFVHDLSRNLYRGP